MKTKFIMMFVTVLVAMISVATFNPFMGPLARTMGLSEVQSGSLVTVTGICWIGGSFLWGRSSRSKRKTVMILAIISYGITVLAFAVLADRAVAASADRVQLFWSLFGLRAAAGLFFGAIPAMAQGFLMEWTTAESRTAGMAMYGAANGLGFVVGPALGAGLAAIGLTAPMYVAAVLLLAVSVCFALFVPNEPAAAMQPQRNSLTPFDPRFRLYLAVGLILSTVMIILQVTSGFYMQDLLHVSSAKAAQIVGTGLSIGGLLVVLAQIAVSRFLKWKPSRLLQFGLLLVGSGFVCFLIFPSLYLLAFMLFGFGIGLTMPGYTAAASLSVEDSEQTGVASFIGAAQGVGSFIGPITGTLLYTVHSSLPYLLCTLLAWLFAILAWRTRAGIRTSVENV